MISINFTLVIQIVLFLALMGILNALLFKPVLRVLDERRERIDGGRARAHALDEETNAKIKECEARFQEARVAGAAERTDIRAKGQEKVQQQLTDARGDADRILREMRERLVAEQDAARAQLEAEVTRLARDVAGKVLGRIVA